MRLKLVLIMCLGSGIGMYGYAVYCGIGLTYDSQHYLSAAKSLLQRGVLLNADGSVYSNWPPLYPIFLAAFQANLTWIKVGQALIFFGTTYLMYRISLSYIQDWTLFAFLVIITTAGTPIMLVTVFVWSEGLFILLTLGMYLLFRKYISNKSNSAFVGLILLSNLLCLQRLTGILFVLSFGLLLWLELKDVKKNVLYFSLSLFGMSLWLWRNSQIEVSPSFIDNIFVTSIEQTLTGYVEAISNWILPTGVPFILKLVAVLVWIGGLLVCWIRFSPSVHSFVFQANFLGWLYLLCMIGIGGTWSEIDRFAAPAYLWIMAGLVAGIDTWFLVNNRRWLMISLISIWLLYPVARTIKNSIFWHTINCSKNATLK